MKMKKTFVLMLALLVSLSAVGCGNNSTEKQESSQKGDEGIVIWASTDSGAVELAEKQVEAFKQANPDITEEITVVGINDAGYSATEVIEDPDNAADIYVFSQDQLARLIAADCLSEVSGENASAVKNENDSLAVSAASYNNKLYAYPVSSDNGYFMYYDKNVIKEDQIDDLATILEACETADKVFCMRFDDDSAWYNASFFIGTGCVSEWETDADGNFTGYTDTYNSDAGLKALKGLKILTDSPIAYSATKALNFSKDAAVIISGAWESEEIKAILGDDMGVTDLPSFTVDGETYHMGSFAGYKMIGVKPQEDAETESVCHRLAAYLASEECQLERYEALGWGPCNTNALNNENVKQNAALTALAQQSAYAVPQGQYPAEWWDIVSSFGSATKHAKTDADLNALLENYEEAIKKLCK